MTKISHTQKSQERNNFPLKPLIFGSLAAAFEWYDYALFGYFATIIGTQFFPAADPFTSILSSFAVFASGFAMRPLGAILFGYIGDRVGRKYALGASLLLMAVPTTALGLLPTYETIGIWATICLVLIRLLQGLSVGGNYGGSYIFTIENAPEGRKGFAGSLASFGTIGGMLLGSSAATFLTAIMSAENLVHYGWRIPFLLGSLSGLIGLAIRHFVAEEEPQIDSHITQSPLQEILKQHLKGLIRSIAIIMLDGVGIYIFFVFMTTYATTFLHMPLGDVLFINTVTMALLVMTIPFFGWLGDKLSARRILIPICWSFILLAPALFWWLTTANSLNALWSLQCIFALVMAAVYGTVPITVAQAFPRHVRYTASGLSFNISVAVFGGTAPFVVTYFIQHTGNLMVPAIMLCAVGILSLWAISRR